MMHIIDYGMGNLGSVRNMIKYLGFQSKITSEVEEIKSAEKLILPGVGSFDNGMARIGELGLQSILDKMALEKKIPILGICLGMQLMTKRSEEGTTMGLGWIDAETVRIDPNGKKIKVPHMGWNNVSIMKSNPLVKDMDPESRFYFVHSYHVKCKDSVDVIGKTKYGTDFTSIICKENVFGCQFHPEKSHRFGMKIFKNFAEL